MRQLYRPLHAYEDPTPSFPFKIKRRINFMAYPRRGVPEPQIPETTENGVRLSALRARISSRVVDIAWPSLRYIRETKRQYKSKFSQERLEWLNQIMAKSSSTIYAKLANVHYDVSTKTNLVARKKRGYAATDFKKRMDFINRIAEPKRQFDPEPIDRGEPMPQVQIVTSVQRLMRLPDHRVHRTLSQDLNYRDPTKVSPMAMKYILTEHTKRLAQPRVYKD